jgi:hypothetical protein
MSETGRVRRKVYRAEPGPLGCPFCVEGKEFKAMGPGEGANGWYMCGNCGHLAVPMYSEFHLRSAKCSVLSRTRFRPV